jgi:hypothetical protein
MKNNITVFLSLVLILAVLPAGTTYQKKIGNYLFFAEDKDSLIVDFFIQQISHAEMKFQYFFGNNLKRPVYIILPGSDTEYLDLTESNIPEWSGGIAYTALNRIILKPGDYFDPDQYSETLLHEITHIYLAEMVGVNRLPLWINEGLAMYMSKKRMSWQESILVGNSLAAGHIYQLTEIDSLLTFPYIKAKVAYLEAYLAIEYLIKQLGEQKIQRFIMDFKQIESIDQVFLKNAGYDFYDFEIDFYKDIKKQYRWMILLQFENLLWLSLVLIIFIIFIFIKLHNRKVIKSWDDPEPERLHD